MKSSLFVVCAAAFLTSGAGAADEDAVVADKDTQESKPIELSTAQMDQITAGTLELNNGTGGKLIFENFDNPAPFPAHPNFFRNGTALTASTGHGPSVQEEGNEGPWSATIASPVISCVGALVVGSISGNTNCIP
jgi:hypothetical protein